MRVVTVPIAAHADKFRWQLDLFWFAHQRLYGADAAAKMHAVVVDCNGPDEPRIQTLPWDIDVPHTVCASVFDWPRILELPEDMRGRGLPLNIQLGLKHLIDTCAIDGFDDDLVIELTDCDMLHFRPRAEGVVAHDKLYVSDIYEKWHLHSKGEHKHVIERYFQNGGGYYNGGFVPIVGTVATFRKIMYEWIAVHIDILKRDYPRNIHWWAGMYALQAACEKAKVEMVAEDTCYAPGIYPMTNQHYIGHYSVDKRFDKRAFPKVDLTTFEDNPYYRVIAAWIKERGSLF